MPNEPKLITITVTRPEPDRYHFDYRDQDGNDAEKVVFRTGWPEDRKKIGWRAYVDFDIPGWRGFELHFDTSPFKDDDWRVKSLGGAQYTRPKRVKDRKGTHKYTTAVDGVPVKHDPDVEIREEGGLLFYIGCGVAVGAAGWLAYRMTRGASRRDPGEER